jgi:hypothetical protein
MYAEEGFNWVSYVSFRSYKMSDYHLGYVIGIAVGILWGIGLTCFLIFVGIRQKKPL